MWGYGDNFIGWGGMIFFGFLFMVLWWALIIAGVVVFAKWLIARFQGARGDDKTPVDILKERYAKGEIDKVEFEEKKKDLL